MKKSYKNLVYLLLIGIGVGIYFFSKKLSNDQVRYYGYFGTVAGLENGSPVLLTGVKIGKVQDIDIDEHGSVRVTLKMQKNEQLPAGSQVMLASGAGVLSGKNIEIILGTGKEMLADGSVLPTHTNPATTESLSARITPIVASAKILLKGADSGLAYVNYFVRTGLTAKAVRAMIELDSQSRNLSDQAKSFNEKSLTITKGIRSLREGTKGLAGKSGSIDSTIQNAEKSTNDLAKKEMRKSVEELRANIAKLNNSLKAKQTDKPDDLYPKLKGSLDTLKSKVKTMRDNGAKAAQEGK